MADSGNTDVISLATMIDVDVTEFSWTVNGDEDQLMVQSE